jgi:hypothetical protein
MGFEVKQHISQTSRLCDFFNNTPPTAVFDSAVLTTCETLFYTAVSQTNSKNRIVKCINEFAISHFQQIRFLFCISNVASSLYFLDKQIFQISGLYLGIGLFSIIAVCGLAVSSNRKKPSNLLYKFFNLAKSIASIRLLIEKNYFGFITNCMGGFYNHYLTSKLETTDFVDLITKAAAQRDNQTNFEDFQACYNLFQSALISLKKYPEFKEVIANIEYYSWIVDLICLAITLHFLENHICKSIADSYGVRQKKINIFWIKAAAVGVISLAISYYMNQSLKPKVNISELLKEMDLPAPFKDNTKLDWNTPVMSLFFQAVCLSRLFATAALTSYSSNNKANLVSLASLSYNFYGLSNLRWIRLNQTIFDPAKKALEMGGQCDYSVTPQNISKLDWEADFMVSSSCFEDKEHMKSIIKSISDYSNNFLKGSSWHSYWKIKLSQGGSVLEENLIYEIKLIPQNPPACACSSLAELTGSLWGRITEKVARKYYYFSTPTQVASVIFN